VGLSYEVSNENSVCGLAGTNWNVGVSSSISIPTGFGPNLDFSYEKDFGPGGGQETIFTAGAGTPGEASGDVSANVSYAGAIAGEFQAGSTPFNVVAGIITGLNDANPLHWVAGPLNLYGPSLA
jgi:hypothetical protein